MRHLGPIDGIGGWEGGESLAQRGATGRSSMILRTLQDSAPGTVRK
jgi:hypothetical protein